MPGHSVDTSESQDNFEAKFQLSFKTKVVQEIFGDRGDLWFGYTQSSRWQVYSAEDSAPLPRDQLRAGADAGLSAPATGSSGSTDVSSASA